MTTENNQALWQRREQAVARGVGSIHQRFVETANSSELTDVEGTRYIDFGTGIAVCNTGHGHHKIVKAVTEQIEKFSHVSFQVNPYKIYVELAEKLNKLAPGNTDKKSLFVTTGAEAVENAIKIARAHTKRHGVIAFRGGYHGRTMMTMAMTGKVAPYQANFGPMPAGVFHGIYPSPYLGISDEDALSSLNDIFMAQISPKDVAAIILEPVQGEGGFYIAPPSFVQKLRALCDEHGILLIADEIQSGFARTGKYFAAEYSGIEPDLITIAKAMAGGFPIAGVIGKADIMDAPDVGGLGGTYGGSPLGCAAALEVLKIIEDEKLCERADTIGNAIKQRLEKLRSEGLNAIGDIRGLGAMIAAEFVTDGDVSRPNAAIVKSIVSAAAEKGLILLSCGMRGNVIRFLPALTATDAIVEEALDILESIIREHVKPAHDNLVA